MSILDNLALGFSVALSIEGLLYCFVGVTLGTLVGILPGVGVMATLAILMPITFHFEPVFALIMLAGIYYGAAFGGSTASILLNLPGTANTAITALDGYPMTQNGRAGIALFMTAIASFVGSTVGLLFLAGFSPLLAKIALNFGSPEYFSLMVLGLLSASLLSSGSVFRAFASIVLGLVLGLVGTDVSTGIPRFTMGLPALYEGIPLVAISLGLFGLPEVIKNAGKMRGASLTSKDITFRSMVPTREDWRRSFPAMGRGTVIGSFFGALPGTGSLIATFVAYATEKKVHKNPEEFGKGAIEGITAPESANSSACQTAFIPTLTLGIPGDAIMALMLGVLLIHGVAPGPRLISEQPDLFWGLVVSFFIGNLILMVLNIPLIGVWVRVLTIPYAILFPAIVVFVCVGVYSVNYASFDVIMVMFFAVVGYVMLLIGFEPAPMILGMVLGPLMEENLRRSLQISGGDVLVFLERPVSAVCLALTALLVIWFTVSALKRARARRSTIPG